jgi:hypothetical protein
LGFEGKGTRTNEGNERSSGVWKWEDIDGACRRSRISTRVGIGVGQEVGAGMIIVYGSCGG